MRAFTVVVIIVLVTGIVSGEAFARKGGENRALGADTQTAAPRKCVTKERTVSKAVCPSRRQRIEVCTGGGQQRVVKPLNCL